MTSKVDALVAEMRERGIRRLVFFTPGDANIQEIELFDVPRAPTEPAPPLEPETPAEDKPPGSCAKPGCLGKAGFHFAPAFCEKCGLAEFGVAVK